MSIFYKGREIAAVYYGKRAIAAIYKGSRLVWQALRSCFGAGFWANEKPWVDDEGWKNYD